MGRTIGALMRGPGSEARESREGASAPAHEFIPEHIILSGVKEADITSFVKYMITSLTVDPLTTSFAYDLESKSFIHLEIGILPPAIGIDTSINEILDWIDKDDHAGLLHHFNKLIKGELKGSLELRLLVSEELLWFRVTPFVTKDRRIISGVIEDITAEKNNFQSIHKYANKKNSVLNMLSHDLRGPLEIAKTLTRSLNKELGSTTQKLRSVAEIIDQSLALVNDLISRELLETMEVELVLRKVDIALKTGQYLDECRRAENTIERKIELLTSSSSIFLTIDEAKFMQILNNLMSNALKFTSPGDTISVSILDKVDAVLFVFRDTGIGIPKELQPVLFDKFTKAGRKGLNGEPSIGLGLSLVRIIVNWHKGKVWCESEEGKGTSFYFEIPKMGELN